MTEALRYTVRAVSVEIEAFLPRLETALTAAGWEARAHLHEAPHPTEIFEYERGGEILSVEIDRESLDACELRITCPGHDPVPLVLSALAARCADLAETFAGPIAGWPGRDALLGGLQGRLEDLLGRTGPG